MKKINKMLNMGKASIIIAIVMIFITPISAIEQTVWQVDDNKDSVMTPIFEPELEISVEDGVGLKLIITNVGDADANNIRWNLDINDGLAIKPRNFYGHMDKITPEESYETDIELIGIGLGILRPIPEIKIEIRYDEGPLIKQVKNAKILFSSVELQ